MATAIFAAGCFWGIEHAYRQVPGVGDVTVGYTGGHTENPTYEAVCGGDTGHAEAVRVVYDEEAVTYDQLLDLFWEIHDPTQLNRQGPDVGSQYRSAIFTEGADQQAAAEASRDRRQASGAAGGTIVTEIVPAGPFHDAEDYHQNYFAKRGQARWF
jgi:peptide-methionine (S)-S-oxide reductase